MVGVKDEDIRICAAIHIGGAHSAVSVLVAQQMNDEVLLAVFIVVVPVAVNMGDRVAAHGGVGTAEGTPHRTVGVAVHIKTRRVHDGAEALGVLTLEEVGNFPVRLLGFPGFLRDGNQVIQRLGGELVVAVVHNGTLGRGLRRIGGNLRIVGRGQAAALQGETAHADRSDHDHRTGGSKLFAGGFCLAGFRLLAEAGDHAEQAGNERADHIEHAQTGVAARKGDMVDDVGKDEIQLHNDKIQGNVINDRLNQCAERNGNKEENE